MFERELLENPELGEVYFGIELPLIPHLGRMMANGVAVDGEALQSADDDLAEQEAALEAEIRVYMGDINLNSPAQKAAVLFGVLLV